MTNVWLVLTHPYAYDRAMWHAMEQARSLNTGLEVVFFIKTDAVDEMIHELGETGWLGPGSLRTLQTSISGGYRALAGDVLERVKRKVTQVEVTLVGVVEEPSLKGYIQRLLEEGVTKLIISGSRSLTEVDTPMENVEWVEED